MHFSRDGMILLSRSRRRGRKCLQLWQDERVEERLTNCHMRYTWQVAANRLADYESSVGADRTELQNLFVLRLVPVVVIEVQSRWKKNSLRFVVWRHISVVRKFSLDWDILNMGDSTNVFLH